MVVTDVFKKYIIIKDTKFPLLKKLLGRNCATISDNASHKSTKLSLYYTSFVLNFTQIWITFIIIEKIVKIFKNKFSTKKFIINQKYIFQEYIKNWKKYIVIH